MKKITLIAAFIIFAGLNGLFAQKHKVNPIPSYNVQLTAISTAFVERHIPGPPQREKRDMEVVISSSSAAPIPIPATIWVLDQNGSEILGPFAVYPNEQLSVPIDNGNWGVVINCTWEGTANVWIE
jgi:hypothetical protein